MIRTGREEDKKAIFDLYSKAISLNYENRGYYFAKSFIANNLLVNEVNGHVVSSVQVNYYPIMLHGKKIMAAYIFGQFYDKSKTLKVLNPLLDSAIDFQNYKSLITLLPIEGSNIKDYTKYGFEPVYVKRQYTISRDDLDNSSYAGVSKEFKIDDLMSLYNQFTENFDGYMFRERSYWLNLLDLLQFKHYNLAVYYNESGKAEGYCIYFIEASKIVVKEIVYLNGTSLTRLLCYCLRLKKNIVVLTSEDEDLTKAYPNIKYKNVVSLMAKINDFNLFNRLFNSKAETSIDGFNLKSLPLFLSEETF